MSASAVWVTLFALAVGALLWSYVLYPPLVIWLSQRRERQAATVAVSGFSGGTPDNVAFTPRVAVLIAAYNEAMHIGARVRNLLQQDYPAGLDILVGSDGSHDATVATARAAAVAASAAGGAGSDAGRVQVIDFPLNRGKASVLNDLCKLADAEVLVFSDANTEFAPDTIRQLLAPFRDPGVGVVCGELRLQASGGNQDHAYWSFEQRLKAAESRLGGLLGANGGVYALRRELYRPLEPDMICDDFVLAMNATADGWKSLYCAEALAFEPTPSDEASEFHRRVRIGIGNYQALFRRPQYLLAAPWTLRCTYLSHKVLRWLTPLWLAIVLLSSLLLSEQPLFRALWWGQLAALALAAGVFLTRRSLPWPATLRAGMLFALLNVAFTVAFARFMLGNYRGSWRRTVRE